MDRFATVVRDSNDAITVQNLDGKIVAWNKGAEQMYGWNESEALQMNIRQLVPKGTAVELDEFTRKLESGEILKSFETQRRCKNGKVLDVWLTVTALKDDSGEPVEIATTERDITRLKQSRETLFKS